MWGELRILYLLILKNLVVRKRHWIGSIFELVLPGCIVALILIVRSWSDGETIYVKHNTYFPIKTKDYLVDNIARSTTHLYYKPRNNFTNRIMEMVLRCTNLQNDQLFGFDTDDEMLQSHEIQKNDDSLISVYAIDFADTSLVSSTPKKFKYTIRQSDLLPEGLFDDESQLISTAAYRFTDAIDFVALQMCLDNAFIDNVASSDAVKPEVVIQMMPFPPHHFIDTFAVVSQGAFHLFGGLLFVATIYLIPTYVCAEKTSGVNTLLKMNGVKSYENFLSWLMTGMLFGILPIFSLTVMLKLNLFKQIAIYYDSNCVIIWFALFISFTHLYAFCLHVASYFSRAWLAQMVATIVSVAMNIVSMQFEKTNKIFLIPYLGLFFPTVAAMRIFDELNHRCDDFAGAHWSNLFESANRRFDTTGSLGFIILFSILGTILHFILALYLDAVLPSKYGVQKQPLFFLKYFKKNRVSSNYGADSGIDSTEGQPKILEPVNDGALEPGIQLRHLAKSFTSGYFKASTVEAVRGVTLDFYKGQITALLGHNGAGKTTTFSILTGLTAPSAGTVYVNGKDITKDLDKIRSDLGVCPQENIMFPDLTVLEQLRFVGLLKQNKKTRKQVIQEVDDLLTKLAIGEKRNVLPHKLSGGQKRRLCLGMALIGNASTIFLDEPTSGMDPETSRGTWDIILKYRKQKTIIITTHSMEEADVLGDRIAIMHSGKMKCYGTSMFLKKFYGHNYHNLTLSTTPRCDVAKIQEMVGSEAKMNIEHHGKIIINVPFTNSLPKILDNMDTQKAELGITGVSISMITLEQVFLKAAEEEDTSAPVDDVNGTEPSAKVYKLLTGPELIWQKIIALLLKRVAYFRTDKSLLEMLIIGAVLAIALPTLLNNLGKSTSSINTLSLDLGLYENSEVLIYSKNQTVGEMYRKIIEQQGGKGTLTKANNSLSHELLSRARMNLAYYKSRMIIAAEFNSSLSANALYSGGAKMSAPITVNAMSNLVLKVLAGDEYSIAASMGDLPRLLSQATAHKSLNRFNIISRVFTFFTIFFYLVALFLKHPHLENTVKIKQLQRMAGVSSFLYWGTMFVVDYAVYTFLALFLIVGIFVTDFSTEANVMNSKEIGIVFMLFLLFGINILLLVYVCSFMKKPFHTVYSLLGGVPLFIAFVVVILNEVLPLLANNGFMTTLILRRIFSLEPHVSFVFGYVKFLEIVSDNARCRGVSNNINKAACAVGDLCCDMKCSDGYCKNPIPYFNATPRQGGLEEFVIYLLLTPIMLLAILGLLEYQVFGKLLTRLEINKPKFESQDKVLDSKVEEETSIVRQAINQRASKPDYDDDNVFLAFELSKYYGKLVAVKEVNFRVKRNECFGLLGVNGAGKSTTFRMLVGEEVPSSGVLHRDSYSIKSNRTEYLAGMGYCPQNDALIPFFNAVDHLTLFARLRGIPESDVMSEVRSWIDKLRLIKHAHNPSGSYSGGNKRRLNIAMALIASPKMVLLDEPTTGVDPAARRLVWTILQSCQASGQAIILTSHSMEECEALCNRLVIMVRGRLLCVGASEELKERFGAGFNITIRINPGRSDQDNIEIKDKIQKAFTCELKDEHPGYLFYHVTDSVATWVQMFGTMNKLKSDYECIEDFTVSTSTLEQLFMQFARSSVDPPTESLSPNQTNNEITSV